MPLESPRTHVKNQTHTNPYLGLTFILGHYRPVYGQILNKPQKHIKLKARHQQTMPYEIQSVTIYLAVLLDNNAIITAACRLSENMLTASNAVDQTITALNENVQKSIGTTVKDYKLLTYDQYQTLRCPQQEY